MVTRQYAQPLELSTVKRRRRAVVIHSSTLSTMADSADPMLDLLRYVVVYYM